MPSYCGLWTALWLSRLKEGSARMSDWLRMELYRMAWKVSKAKPEDKPRLRRRHIELLKKSLGSRDGVGEGKR